jgi:hypothetical protein
MRKQLPQDNEGRKGTMILILIATVLGILAIRMAYDYIDDLKSLADHDLDLSFTKLQKLSSILMGANAVFSSLFAFWFAWLAWQVWKNKRFPPPNVRVIQTRKILVGVRARMIALLCLIIALLLMSTNIYMWRLCKMLDAQNKRHRSLTSGQQQMDGTLTVSFLGSEAVCYFPASRNTTEKEHTSPDSLPL